MKREYLVITDDQVIGEYSQLEDAQMYQYIVALRSNQGDKIYVAKILNCMEVAE